MAVDLDEPVRAAIQAVESELAAGHKGQRFVPAENLHFTLKFLGEVADESIPAIESCIRKAVEGFRPFSLRVQGMGHFGSRKFARVLWVGVRDGREEMARLSKELEKNLSTFKKSDKPPSSQPASAGKFRSPHITICRPRNDTTALIQDIGIMKDRDFGAMDVKGISLKSSTLTPQGSVYEDVRAFALGQ
jgi:2'-5' RNA ligase